MENNTASERKPLPKPKSTFKIQRSYVKEQACKLPNTYSIFKDNWKPGINLEMCLTHNVIEDSMCEVILQLAIIAKNNQRIAFVLPTLSI